VVQHLTVTVWVLLLASAAVWLVIELRHLARDRPEAVKADRGSRIVLGLSAAVGFDSAYGIAHVVPAAAMRNPGLAAWIGLGVFWCGIGLRLWSFRTLGRYFTFTVQTSADQPVITAGPYRVVRHPSYTGVLLAAIGLSLLLFANWLSLLLVTAALFAGLGYRIRVEERALLVQLGDSYRHYASTRKRLVPFVW
jgi:protein-S-isoprenylcysteine O-methyltransferase Ste14